MRNKTPYLYAIALLAATFLLHASANAQFMKRYQPDSTTLANVSTFRAYEIIETGIPGREFAIAGAIVGQDTGSNTIQAFFCAQISDQGNVKRFDFFEDLSPFLLSGPRAFGMCYDGASDFYFAIGTNNNQVIAKTGIEGNMKWATDVNHHEYYDILCEGTDIVFFGQDEPMTGGHDYSIGRMDSSGGMTPSWLYGTSGFDIPERLVAIPDGFLMSGSGFNGLFFDVLAVKTNANFDLVFGQGYDLPGYDLLCKDVAVSTDHGHYNFVGKATSGTEDSIFVFRMDSAGTPNWMRLYGIAGSDLIECNTAAIDPNDNGIIIGGYYRDSTTFGRPFAMKVSESGTLEWAHTYGALDSTAEEIIYDIVVSSDQQTFYATGSYTLIDSNTVIRKMPLIRADLATGTTGGCDTALSLAGRSTNAVVFSTVNKTPFFASNPYSFGQQSGSMEWDNLCSTIVSIDVPMAESQFSFVNPAGNTLVLDYNLVLENAEVELFDLQGRKRWTRELDPGLHRRYYDISALDSGFYLVRLRGEGWVSEAKKLMVTR